MPKVTRRAALETLGVGAAAGLGLGAGLALDRPSATAASAVPAVTVGGAARPVTVASWVATRGRQYFIGHRGSGDVYPEHSFEGYQAVIRAGARCIEISVGMTSDGELICLHDLTLDRTTTGTGPAAMLPATALRGVRLRAPQLGPAWADDPVPQVPRLLDVLIAVGGRVVICLEAKLDAAYPSMIALAESLGLQSSVIVKASWASKRIRQAQAAGYPAFAYFGSEGELSLDRISSLASRLDQHRDYLILPSAGAAGRIDSSFVTRAVATSIPTWVFGTHRRSDAAFYFGLGCAGIVGSSYQYLATDTAVATTDCWAYGAITPGEMTRDPGSSSYAPTWSAGQIQLGVPGRQHFLTLGNLGPVKNSGATYQVDLQASWPTLPADRSQNLTLAFGHRDDAYYEHRSGLGDGYHAIVRADGGLELFRHENGRVDGIPLGTPVRTEPPAPGQWMTFRLTVTPTRLTWARSDVADASVTAADPAFRGGYLHIGRSSVDGVAAFRALSIT